MGSLPWGPSRLISQVRHACIVNQLGKYRFKDPFAPNVIHWTLGFDLRILFDVNVVTTHILDFNLIGVYHSLV